MKKEKDYLKPYRKRRFFKPREKKLNRSMAGNTLLFVIMAICGVAMVMPLVMVINNCLKPLDELYQLSSPPLQRILWQSTNSPERTFCSRW